MTPKPTTENAYVYRWYDADGVLLYTGIAKDVALRTARHRYDGPIWMLYATRQTVSGPMPLHIAEAIETASIRGEVPVFNIRMTRVRRSSSARLKYLYEKGAGDERDRAPAEEVAACLGLTVEAVHLIPAELMPYHIYGGKEPERWYDLRYVRTYARRNLGRHLRRYELPTRPVRIEQIKQQERAEYYASLP